MSLIELNDLTERVLTLKSAAAVKIAHLLLSSETGVIPVTWSMLGQILNCSAKALRTGVDELRDARLLQLGRNGSLIILNLRDEEFERSIVYKRGSGVHEVNSVQSKNGNAQREEPASAADKNSSKSQKSASKSENRASKDGFSSRRADLDDEEDKSTSSSSSLKSAAGAQNHALKCKKGAPKANFPAGEDETAGIVLNALYELGMYRDHVFQKVMAAADGLPPLTVARTLDKCLIRLPQSPTYLTKALEAAKRQIAEQKEIDAENQEKLCREIALGEQLLAGKKLKFERLGQSKHLKKFASPLFDPLKKHCLIDAEHRALVREVVEGLKAKAGGGVIG